MKKRYVFMLGILSGFVILTLFILTYVSKSSTIQLSTSDSKDENVSAQDLSGISIKEMSADDYNILIDHIDHQTLVNFWASWCKPCIEEIPFLIDYCDNNDIKLVFISVDRNNDKQLNLIKKQMSKLGISTSYILKDSSLFDFTNKEGMENFTKKTSISFSKSSSIPYFIYYNKDGDTISSFNGFDKNTAFNAFLNIKLNIH